MSKKLAVKWIYYLVFRGPERHCINQSQLHCYLAFSSPLIDLDWTLPPKGALELPSRNSKAQKHGHLHHWVEHKVVTTLPLSENREQNPHGSQVWVWVWICQGLSPGTPHCNPLPFVQAKPSQYYVINQTGWLTSDSSLLDSDLEMPTQAAV